MTTTFADKRKFYRHPLCMPIQYQDLISKNLERSSSVDLSEGGMCVLGNRFIAKGTRVQVKVPVGDQIFQIVGQIAYCNRVSSLDRYRIGVEFLDQTSVFRTKLAVQVHEIQQYRKRVSSEIGRDVSEEEAARQWIEKYAQHFSSLF
ncbi:MAG: PilZ domain-containing protein [Candidatus Omnitrophica bacterium]|nr:PilZ domain-containing protein [Candidatus Omnitrophota bacterium]